MGLEENIYFYCRKQEAVYKNDTFLAHIEDTPALLEYIAVHFNIKQCTCVEYCKMAEKVMLDYSEGD